MSSALIQVFYMVVSLVGMTYVVAAQIPRPALPMTSEVVVCFPDTTGYTRITVGPAGRQYQDLQQAIDAAPMRSVIILDAGETYSGSFTLPKKSDVSGWVIITSSRANELPKDIRRVTPSMSPLMPRIVTVNTSGVPVFSTMSEAHHYRLVGLEITASPQVVESYGLVNLGDGGTGQTTMSSVPHHFVVDRCYIHGHDEGTIMKYGVRLDCSNAAIIDSYLSQFHSIGFDAQAVSGINGPGPFKIINNYLSASGENIMFGGAAPSIQGLVPSDIEIRQNHMVKPLTWWVKHPSYAGKHWTIKNLFELKTGRRVLLDGNTLENCWADLPIGQSGAAILLTVRAEGGKSPQADVSDVTITNNIVKNVGEGISISGTDEITSNRSSRILIYNNKFLNINGPEYGDGNDAGPNVGTFLKIGDPTNVILDRNTIEQTGAITWAYKPTTSFAFVGNRTNCFRSAGGYQGMYGPGKSDGNASIAFYFPDITDVNKHFDNNALIGGNAASYSNYATVSKNLFPSSAASVSDEIGAQQALIDSAMSRREDCDAVTSTYEFRESTTSATVFPNPADGEIVVRAPHNRPASFCITDLVGRTVLTCEMQDTEQRARIDHLPQGLYLVQVIADGNYVTLVLTVSR
ncbi:MAG: T9SS type A sorting domain-containing protein [Candidatus Kapabacteria bacterium]|nr:T9SS type A sorting domain-containing protein [Candidatus Kapabacteria bacterium]